MIELPENLFEDEQDSDLLEGLALYDAKDWRKSLAPLEKSARKGNVTAVFKLANSFDNLGREDDAIPLWEAAAHWGHLGACNNYAILLNRVGDTAGAQDLYLRSAQSGNAQAMFNYALTFDPEEQVNEFREWLQKAAEDGMLRAQAMLGDHLYTSGLTVEGLLILEDAMAKGSLSAHVLAGKIALANEELARSFDIANKALELRLVDDDKHLVPNIYLIRGLSSDKLGMLEQAIADIKKSEEMGYDVSIAPLYLRNPGRNKKRNPQGSQASNFLTQGR